MVRSEEDLRQDDIIVSLLWTQEYYDYFPLSYNVSILPTTNAMLLMIDSTRANVTLPYNTVYSVSVVADLCGQSSTAMLIEVYYGKYNHYRFKC